MKYLPALITFAIIICGCNIIAGPENPQIVASLYCDCLKARLVNAPDSSVNINDCNAVFFTSRFMQIHLQENNGEFEQHTLDSALHFFIEVRDVTDSMCYNKIDFKKVKKIRQA